VVPDDFLTDDIWDEVGGSISPLLRESRNMSVFGPTLTSMAGDKKTNGGVGGGDNGKFGNKGHRFIAPKTKPSQRPKPQPPQPDKKK